MPKHDATLASFNCNKSDILVLLRSCPCSDTSIDGISFKVLKAIAGHIIYPLKVIFQHSFHNGVFPPVWKKAVITPLYKGKGDRSALDSYRPISICSCLGKIFERVACSQLTAFLSVNQVNKGSQHDFTSDRSCLTNLLEFDQHIVKAIIDEHPYDIVCFDFKKAFDKIPHYCILQAVSRAGMCDYALAWLASFLEDRSQVVRVGNSYSSPAEITSGLVQGSRIGPALFTLVIDNLIQRLHHRIVDFADYVKFVADVAVITKAEVQEDIDVVADWSKEYNMPLSIDKTVVMYDGRKQPNKDYYLDGYHLSSRDSFSDLEVSRSADESFSSHF